MHARPHPSGRPGIWHWPQSPWFPMPPSPSRQKVCVVRSHDDFKTDDSAFIKEAIQSCNNGGHVLFPEGSTYVIGTAMDLTGLRHVDIDIQGYIQFTNDTDYWQAHALPQVFQNATTFFQIGGNDVNIYGGGMLDGNGQIWYDLYAKNIYILRPVLFGITGLHTGSVSNLVFRYSPQWYNWIANSTNVVYDNINIGGLSSSNNTAKNTDGWDTHRSSNLVIQNSIINNGDDCVSFKPNSTQILVQNLHCNGSHGISVGSLGQYKNEVDIVEDVHIANVHMANASDGARIKVWPGSPAELAGDLQGGGGSGYVNNIKYEGFQLTNVDYAIEVTQCYGQNNLTLCNQFPSNLTISNVQMTGFSGTTSKAHSPVSGYVVCSSPTVCNNITLTDIDITSPEGVVNEFVCGNVDTSMFHGITCKAA